MMVDFASTDKGKWFYFDESDPTFGGVKLRLLTPVEEDEIDQQVTKVTSKPYRGMMVESHKVDNKLRNKLMYPKWIIEWDNIELDGKKLECTPVNIVTMMTKITFFARFVLGKILELGEDTSVIEATRVKNSKSSLSGG